MFFYLLSYFILTLPLLPALVSSDCVATCDSYNNGLRSCQTKNSVVAVGSPMDSNTIHCMCSAKSNLTDMDTCMACLEETPSTNTTSAILLAWSYTCKAQLQFGDKQAALCWQNQPDNTIPCSTKSDGYGGAPNGTTGSASR